MRIVVEGKLDGFAEAEASVLNAFNATLTGCGTVNTMQQSKEFLDKMGAYEDALSEDGIGSVTEGDLKYEWAGEAGSVRLTISIA